MNICISCLLKNRLLYNVNLFFLKQSKVRSVTPLFNEAFTTSTSCSVETVSNEGENLRKQPIKFNEIYRFPAIRIGYALNKVKWYQTLAFCAVIPTSGLLSLVGIIDYAWFSSCAITGTYLTFVIYIQAQIFHEALGFIYLSEDETEVKLSYLDFWGNRIDKIYPLQDITPFSDMPSLPTDVVFKKIVLCSDHKFKPKLFLKLGKVTDEDKFETVFGSFK